MDFDDLDDPTPKQIKPQFIPKLKVKKPLQPKIPTTVVKNEPLVEPKPEPMELVADQSVLHEDKKIVEVVEDSVKEDNAELQTESLFTDKDVAEEKDFVVREIDVFFNPQIDENTQLYLMQYPLRPSWRSYDFQECCKGVRVKPKSCNVEIDIEVDVDSRSHLERLNPLMITKTLTSSGKIVPKTGYAVGVLKGEKLYLNPVHAVVQLRPSNNTDDDDKEEEREDKDGTKRSKDINKKQAPASSKKQGKSASSSTQTTNGKEVNIVSSSAQTTNDKESWVPLKYHSATSEASVNSMRKLMVSNDSTGPIILNPHEYLNSFFPRKHNNGMQQSGPSMRQLHSLPLEERLKKWLCEAGEPAYRFSVLMYLAPEVPAESLIEVLQQHAVLVQGLWVPNNSIALPGGTGRELEALARNYLLFKFSQNPTIRDSELVFVKKMSLLLFEALKKLANQRNDLKDWKFKVPADPSFAKRYPDVAHQQKQLWNDLESNIMAKMKAFSVQSRKIETVAPPKRISVSVPTKKREALEKALEVLFKNHSVNSLETIGIGLREMAVSASSLHKAADNNWMITAASCADSRDELVCVLTDFATCIHGAYVANSSQVHPELNEIRKVVIQQFLAAPPNAKLKKALILEACKISLGREILANDYQKIMSELCNSSGSAWMLKTPGGR